MVNHLLLRLKLEDGVNYLLILVLFLEGIWITSPWLLISNVTVCYQRYQENYCKEIKYFHQYSILNPYIILTNIFVTHIYVEIVLFYLYITVVWLDGQVVEKGTTYYHVWKKWVIWEFYSREICHLKGTFCFTNLYKNWWEISLKLKGNFTTLGGKFWWDFQAILHFLQPCLLSLTFCQITFSKLVNQDSRILRSKSIKSLAYQINPVINMLCSECTCMLFHMFIHLF